MKSAWFIMKLWQTGNAGSNNIDKIEGQSKTGYSDSGKAETAIKDLKKKGNWDLKQDDCSFTVMQLWWN